VSRSEGARSAEAGGTPIAGNGWATVAGVIGAVVCALAAASAHLAVSRARAAATDNGVLVLGPAETPAVGWSLIAAAGGLALLVIAGWGPARIRVRPSVARVITGAGLTGAALFGGSGLDRLLRSPGTVTGVILPEGRSETAARVVVLTSDTGGLVTAGILLLALWAAALAAVLLGRRRTRGRN
jgi:hypothetical protein